MTVIIIILALGLAMAIELSTPSSVFMGFARPPVLASVVMYFALCHSAPIMLFAALFGGILSDCIGSMRLGTTSLALAVVGTFFYYCRDTVFSGKLVTNIFSGAVIGISVPLITFALLLLLGETFYTLQLRLLLLRIIGTMIYGAVFFTVIYALLKRLELITGTYSGNSFSDDTHSNN